MTFSYNPSNISLLTSPLNNEERSALMTSLKESFSLYKDDRGEYKGSGKKGREKTTTRKLNSRFLCIILVRAQS